MWKILVAVVVVTMVGGCGAESTSSTTNGSAPPTIPRGATPDAIFDAVVEDLEFRLGVERAEIALLRDEEAAWSDGSLGCPAPGETYTPAPVAGYWLIFDVGGFSYDYRALPSGAFVFCESPRPSGAPTG